MENGLHRRSSSGIGFEHAIYDNRRVGDVLHVYLSGDGQPWVANGRVAAADPTPRDSLALQLLALDPTPAVLVGRPCYHGHAWDSGCASSLWTSSRYSEAVVASLAHVIAGEIERRPGARATLIGFSGGGTLAVLLAARLEDVATLVTVAGNLDPDAWAAHHGYRALEGSLNPTREPALRASLRQIHLAGERDRHVPPKLAELALTRIGTGRLERIPEFDHACCWTDLWPGLLDRLRVAERK